MWRRRNRFVCRKIEMFQPIKRKCLENIFLLATYTDRIWTAIHWRVPLLFVFDKQSICSSRTKTCSPSSVESRTINRPCCSFPVRAKRALQMIIPWSPDWSEGTWSLTVGETSLVNHFLQLVNKIHTERKFVCLMREFSFRTTAMKLNDELALLLHIEVNLYLTVANPPSRCEFEIQARVINSSMGYFCSGIHFKNLCWHMAFFSFKFPFALEVSFCQVIQQALTMYTGQKRPENFNSESSFQPNIFI